MNATGPQHNRIVIITGGIGAGKSVVSRICRLKGYEVLDCDIFARRYMDSDTALHEVMRCRWGEAVVSCGNPDRGAIAAIVFSDPAELEWLNSRVHGTVRHRMLEMRDEMQLKDDLLFVETAIPATADMLRHAEAVWLVDAPSETRVERVMARNAASREEVLRRIDAQASEYVSLPADITSTICNDGSIALLPQIDGLLRRLAPSIPIDNNLKP